VDREERIIENEKLFREVNERVADMQANFSGPDPEWVCECGDETCFDKVSVSIEDYQQVRSRGDWFVIRPGHEKLDVEKIVRQEDGFLVVEKFEL
jgi:23S rRNA A1618 N6-methylase RlmF